ncbi:MAG: hypothetical protein WBI47_08995, partial [Atribacterales bacterium]
IPHSSDKTFICLLFDVLGSSFKSHIVQIKPTSLKTSSMLSTWFKSHIVQIKPVLSSKKITGDNIESARKRGALEKEK